jgi:hypothetical protein
MDDFMRRYTVFHADELEAMLVPQGCYEYRHVADVEAMSLDDAFALTNHRECAWQQHEAVVWSA